MKTVTINRKQNITRLVVIHENDWERKEDMKFTKNYATFIEYKTYVSQHY